MSFADYPVARYIAIFILSWNIAWYIIYLITGFHLRTVGISNGILGSYITLSTTKFNISIGKIKLILWGNRKLIIDDVHVSLNGDEEKHQKSKYTDKKNSSDEITPLSVFPKNPLLKAILRYTAKRIPKIDIEVRNSKVDIHEGNTLALDFLRITLNSRNSKRYNETVKFSGQVFLNDISYITVTGECPVVTDTIKLQLNWQIDLSTGVIYKITTKLYLEYLSVKTFTLIKNISKILERTKNQDITEQNNFQDSSSSSTSSELITKLHRIHRKLYSTVDEVAIHIENVSFTEIPLLDSNNDASIKNYINTHHLPNLSLEYMTKSIAVNYLRLSNKSPAFQVLFDQISDNPFHLTVSIQLFKINYSKLIKTSKDKFINDTEEILNIPQFGFTFKSNVLDHLARGDGFKNCVMELFTSASSPILDLDVVQLTSIVYSVHMITKYIKLLNQRKNNTNSIQEEEKSEEISIRETEFDSESDDLSQSAKSTDSVKKKLLKLLHDNYPKLEVKISFEQPRFIIRDECGINEGMVQLLNFLYSFLNIHLLTTSNREYDISCTFLHPTVQYIEKDIADLDKKIIKTDIFSLKSVTINLDVLKDFKIKPKFKFEDVTINLSELEVLEGIGGVLNKVAGIIDNDLTYGLLNLSLNEVISKEITLIAVEPKRKTNFEKSIFRKLPFWLLEVNISISNISIILGSRSMFIPSESLIDPNSESANFLEDFVGLNQELRTTSITLNNFRLSLLNEEVMREIQNTTEVSKLDDEDIRNTGDISAEETEKDVKPCCWAILIKALALKVLVNHNQTSSSKFLTIPLINLNTIARPLEVPRGSGKLFLSSSIGEINGNYDRYNLFVVLGSVFLLKEFILEPIRQIKQKLKKDIGKINLDDNEQEMLTPETGGLNFLSCDFEVVKTDFILHLSDNFKTRLQLFDLKLGLNESILSLSNSILRFLTVSPIIKSLWTRVLVVDDLKVQLDLNKVIKFFKSNPIPTATKEDLGSKVNPIIEVDASSIRFIQPHQFVVYHLFDNLSISIKVIKHLLQNLAHEDDNSSSDASKHQHKSNCQIVVPHESKPVKVPPTRIRSKKINFLMEDDPFEGELTMIYQLGLAEQRKRLEEYELFSRRIELHNDTLTKEQYESKLDELHKVMSMSWIRKVKVYNAMVNDEIVRNKKYLFGNEAHAIPSELNDDIVPYMLRAPLFLINLDEFDLLAQSTQFALKELPQFLYDIGQQVPKDTVYSMILPTYLELKLGELRIHLRDYPLPLLHVPANIDKSPSLTTSGHFIVAENLVTAKEHLRELIIPLIKDLETKVIKPVDGGDFAPNLSHEEEDTKLGAHRIIIQKSLSTVKIYSDLKFRFQSAQSSRFIWGQSYQFALQQTIMNFDQFSKPPVDPLKKLGIWDKLRYIIHGNFRISVADIGDLQIAIKGSRDPYNLFGASSGFVLGFKDSVEWKINEHDDPRLFFEIVSDKVSFFVPNYLAAPLYAWTRPSNKSIYMPGSKNFVSSTFGYYLEDIPQQDEKDYVNLNKSVLEKNVLKLNGGVNFKVGFLLQRDEIGKKNSKTYESLPHYEVELCNPKYTKSDHDSYAGFRSDYVHMAISLTSDNEGCNNSIHLSPGVFKQLFSWWVLFSGNMMLPIRRGALFREVEEGPKLSRHLLTNKFLFKFKSVYISHIYRDETVDIEDDKIECIGIRAKVDDFVLDLHQRKESRYLAHDGLHNKKKIQKMNFNIGQSHLKKIDLRTVYGIFDQEIYNKASSDEGVSDNLENSKGPKGSKFSTFDDDSTWFDIDDYEEVFIPTLSKCQREIKINPIIYTECFSYLRDTSKKKENRDKGELEDLNSEIKLDKNCKGEESSQSLGLEDNHECQLNSENMFEPLYDLYKYRISEIEQQIKKNEAKGKSIDKLRERIKSLQDNMHEYQEKDAANCGSEQFQHTDLRSGKQEGTTKIEKGTDIEKDEEIATLFHNRFMLISMLLKWNIDNRNLLLKYIQFVQWKAYFTKYLSFEAISTVQELIDKRKEDFNASDVEDIQSSLSEVKDRKLLMTRSGKSTTTLTSEERLANFQPILRHVNSEDKTITEDYLIEIVSPQIQLQSVEAPDSILLITAPSIDVNIISVIERDHVLVDNVTVLEDRYGVLMRDANIFVLNKQNSTLADESILVKDPYGSKESWPPWLGIEICKNGSLAGKENLLVEKTSTMVIYEKSKPLGEVEDDIYNKGEEAEEESQKKRIDSDSSVSAKLLVDVPKFVVTSTSKQYSTLYMLVMSLLFYTEPMNKNLSETLEKLKFSIDFQDLNALHQRLVNLNQYYHLLETLADNYQFRQHVLDNEDLNNYLHINLEKGQIAVQTYLLMQSILSGDNAAKFSSETNPIANWVIGADQIIFHLLQDDRTPILDIAMASGKCYRTVYEDGSNRNRIEVYMMQIFNLLKTATYPQLFGPLRTDSRCHEDENILTVSWKMNRPIGGIKVVENFEVNAQPLNIKIDDITGEALMKYIFQSEDISDSPILKIYNDSVSDSEEEGDDEEGEEEDDEDDEDDDDDGVDDSSLISFHGAGGMVELMDGSNMTGRHRKQSENSSSRKKIGEFMKPPSMSNMSGKNSAVSTSPSGSGSGSGSGSNTFDPQYETDVVEMVGRAKKYMSVENLLLNPLTVLISIKCHGGAYRILNVQDLVITLPIFEITSQVVSAYDITLMFKKTVIKVLLGHTGKLLKNKFTVRRKRGRELIKNPLKPVKKYVKFTKVAELSAP